MAERIIFALDGTTVASSKAKPALSLLSRSFPALVLIAEAESLFLLLFLKYADQR